MIYSNFPISPTVQTITFGSVNTNSGVSNSTGGINFTIGNKLYASTSRMVFEIDTITGDVINRPVLLLTDNYNTALSTCSYKTSEIHTQVVSDTYDHFSPIDIGEGYYITQAQNTASPKILLNNGNDNSIRITAPLCPTAPVFNAFTFPSWNIIDDKVIGCISNNYKVITASTPLADYISGVFTWTYTESPRSSASSVKGLGLIKTPAGVFTTIQNSNNKVQIYKSIDGGITFSEVYSGVYPDSASSLVYNTSSGSPSVVYYNGNLVFHVAKPSAGGYYPIGLALYNITTGTWTSMYALNVSSVANYTTAFFIYGTELLFYIRPWTGTEAILGKLTSQGALSFVTLPNAKFLGQSSYLGTNFGSFALPVVNGKVLLAPGYSTQYQEATKYLNYDGTSGGFKQIISREITSNNDKFMYMVVDSSEYYNAGTFIYLSDECMTNPIAVDLQLPITVSSVNTRLAFSSGTNESSYNYLTVRDTTTADTYLVRVSNDGTYTYSTLYNIASTLTPQLTFDGNNIVMCISNKIYTSTDDGLTWTELLESMSAFGTTTFVTAGIVWDNVNSKVVLVGIYGTTMFTADYINGTISTIATVNTALTSSMTSLSNGLHTYTPIKQSKTLSTSYPCVVLSRALITSISFLRLSGAVTGVSMSGQNYSGVILNKGAEYTCIIPYINSNVTLHSIATIVLNTNGTFTTKRAKRNIPSARCEGMATTAWNRAAYLKNTVAITSYTSSAIYLIKGV